MEVQQQTTRSGFGTAANIVSILAGLAALVVMGAILWRTVKDVPLPAILALPTAAVIRHAPQAQPAPAQPAIDAYNATATAAYNEAVSAPQPNVGQGEPVTTGQRVNEREPAPAVVPTAEPVVESQGGGIFGSKPVIVAPQTTHECRHAQVWTDAGCKNPTPEVK